MRSETYLSWAAKTSPLCKFPCLLNLPTTELEWSSSFSVPPCPLHAGPGLQSNYPRAGESANVQAAEKVPVRGPEAFFFFFFVVNFVIHWTEKAMGSHVFPIPIPPPTSLPTRSLQVLTEHQVRVLFSCIQPGPVICFTLDSTHVSMLFSWNIPPSPSPTESKRLFYKSVSLFLFCI